MRLQLQLSSNTQPVPFTYLHKLTGAIHKWLGPNDLHDATSLYSFGRLRGGQKTGNSLYFPHGANWTVSFQDSEQAWKLAKGILRDESLAFGMRVEKVLEIPIPQFQPKVCLATDGEIVVRNKRADGSREYLLWSDERTSGAMTQLLRRKLLVAGYSNDHQSVLVRFDSQYAKARSKLMDIKGIQHKGSVCPVIIEGTPEAIQFAWLVGVGELTGSGFGALV